MLAARLQLVDGSVMDVELPGVTLAQVQSLSDRGVSGKQIVAQLVSDDIRPPPRFVDFTEDGDTIRIGV